MKTFDEFKKEFEIFTKIDTPEKSAFCETQYQRYLLICVENNRFFEPVEISNDSGDAYRQNLYQLIGFDTIASDQFHVLVLPSFEPERLMILKQEDEGYLLMFTILKESYWTAFCRNNTIRDALKIITHTKLSKVTGGKLAALFDRTIAEAKKVEQGGFTLDGVVYTLAKCINNETKRVFKHSPDPDSPSGKIVSIIEKLFESRDTMNEETLIQIEALIDNVSAIK